MIYKIRKAKEQDAKNIYEIANKNNMDKIKLIDRKTRGFLISNYSLTEYIKFINSAQHFYVVEETATGKIQAFLLAFNQEELKNNTMLNYRIEKLAKNSFIYIKQICVDVNAHGKGFGRMLYEYVMERNSEDLFCSIVLEPNNKASENFHTKLGFNCVCVYKAEDGYKKGIFFWNNPQNDKKYDKEILLTQYERAIELYSHEDGLNWSKINHYLYITGSLLVVISFSTTMKIKIPLSLFLGAVSFLGVAVSLIFTIAIRSGIDYMHERKKAVINIERILINMNGTQVVSNLNPNKSKFIKSPTMKVMKMIPIGGTLIWSMLFVVCVIYFLLEL